MSDLRINIVSLGIFYLDVWKKKKVSLVMASFYIWDLHVSNWSKMGQCSKWCSSFIVTKIYFNFPKWKK